MYFFRVYSSFVFYIKSLYHNNRFQLLMLTSCDSLCLFQRNKEFSRATYIMRVKPVHDNWNTLTARAFIKPHESKHVQITFFRYYLLIRLESRTSRNWKWLNFRFLWQQKKEDLTQSCDKSPYIRQKKSEKQRDNTKNATKNFDYTTIVGRHRTVSWSNNSHRTSVVKPVYERSTIPLTATTVQPCNPGWGN